MSGIEVSLGNFFAKGLRWVWLRAFPKWLLKKRALQLDGIVSKILDGHALSLKIVPCNTWTYLPYRVFVNNSFSWKKRKNLQKPFMIFISWDYVKKNLFKLHLLIVKMKKSLNIANILWKIFSAILFESYFPIILSKIWKLQFPGRQIWYYFDL